MATTVGIFPQGDDDGSLGLVKPPNRIFHWADYVVFALTLIVAVIIGLYYGIKQGRGMSVREMLLGGGNMGAFPVSLSLVATLASTIFVLGVPSEVYYQTEFPLYVALAFIPATIVTAHVFIPMFHSLGVTSAYEYLGLRFNKVIRFGAALIFIVMMNFTQSLSIYTPAVGFSLVAGVSMEVSILAAGVVCTFYTALGGLRAVIVTDIFQIGTILAGIIGMLVKGAMDAGGVDKIFQTSGAANRLTLWSANWGMDTTYSFWSQFFGGTVIFLSLFSANQQTVQRYCSVKKCRDAQKAAYIAMVFYIIMWLLVLMIGLVIYTFYYTCDPMVLQVIYSPDQVLPLFIMDTIGHLNGLPGLFSAAVFGAVLSSVSSGINSLAAVTLEDVIKPVHRRLKKKEVSEEYAKSITRILALFYGALSIALSYIPVKYGTYLINIDVTFSTFGVLGGPIMGAFILGTMVPIANSLGAGLGMIFGTLFGMWMWLGRMMCRGGSWSPPVKQMPSDCHNYYNLTGVEPTLTFSDHVLPGDGIWQDCPMQDLYDISYLWYGLITMSITIATGIFISMVSGGHGGKRVSPDLLCWDRFKKKLQQRQNKNSEKSQIWPTVETETPVQTNPVVPSTDQVEKTEQILLYRGAQPMDTTPTDPNERVLFQAGEPIPHIQQDIDINQIYPLDNVLSQGGFTNQSYIPDSGVSQQPGTAVLYQGTPNVSGNPRDLLLYNPVPPGEHALYQPGEPGPVGLMGSTGPHIQGAPSGNPLILQAAPMITPDNPLYQPGDPGPLQSGAMPTPMYAPRQVPKNDPLPLPAGYETNTVQNEPAVLYGGTSDVIYPQVAHTYGDPLIMTGPVQMYPDNVAQPGRVIAVTPDTQLVHRNTTAQVPTLWS